jgi:diaminohydroxyphosphoribosylaminopyrimidine deaminase/5-amino-6-(5-phosphoribosylamino)uracil reductase
MERALALARSALGSTSPNPAVGAVVVKGGRVVGEGFTQPPSGAHAEVLALRQAGPAARGATLYVTLEPCCHQGRTPPCTRAILEAGVAEVHLAHLDPDPQVDGRGARELESAGVAVRVGEGEEEARRINEAYLKHRATGLPFVIAKFAASLDGKIATTTGDSRWVSGPEAREWAHRQRAQIDAIMVGVKTVLVDNPQLTARLSSPKSARPTGVEEEVRQPLRVVVDSRGRTPASARVLPGPGRVLVATTAASGAGWREQMAAARAEVAILPAKRGRVDALELLRLLGQRPVLSLLVEGGGELLGTFFDLKLVDKVHAIIAPLIIGGKGAPTAVAGRGVRRLGDDLLVTGYVNRSGERE